LRSRAWWELSTLDVGRVSLLKDGKVGGEFFGRLEGGVQELEGGLEIAKVLVKSSV